MSHHYVYELTCIETGIKYIGVRTSNCEPQNDAYMSSSKTIRRLIKEGFSFSKTILSQWSSHLEAANEESRLHVLYDVQNNPNFYNLLNAPFNSKHGTALRGRSYKDIHGEEKAKILKKQKSVQFKNRTFSSKTRQKMRENHADVSGSKNPRAISGRVFSSQHVFMFSFSHKRDLVTKCKERNIPSRPLIRKGRYEPNLTNRNRKFQSHFGCYVIFNE